MTDRILVVEDDPAILRGLRDNLRGETYEVLTASDGETAYSLIREQHPDLVVLDVMLPHLSGIELCRRVRGEGVTTPILMLTAQEQEHDRVNGLDSGADDYVTKPILLSELLARVRGLLRHRRQWRAEHHAIDRDVRDAADVQQRLLPERPPALRTAECAAVCEPARGVGGDYYDFIDLPAGLTGLALADVAGKGITAALTMASLQGMLRAQAPRHVRGVADLAATLNGALHATLAPGRFVTLFYAVYDDAERSLTYVNAGHPAPLLIQRSSTNASASLEACVPPLGLFPSMTAVAATVTLEAGDWLVLFSDGATEALNAQGDEFGRAGVLDTVLRHRDLAADGMRDALRAAIRQHSSGQVQADDVTLMVATIR
jgi:phosphoserine phosphatase RsbU/P